MIVQLFFSDKDYRDGGKLIFKLKEVIIAGKIQTEHRDDPQSAEVYPYGRRVFTYYSTLSPAEQIREWSSFEVLKEIKK